MRAFPSDIVPSGWYMVGWSLDFPKGVAKPLAYFDTDLVAYRGESGEVIVLDAYCKHMGAHLGHGGCVKGDSVACPYHGWVWGPDGSNTEIPYSSPDKMPKLKLKRWLVHEVDDIVLVYYSNDGRPPLYDPPERMIRFDGETWPASEATTKIWLDQKISPQYMAENAGDAAHFKFVHKAADIASINTGGIVDGIWQARLDLTFGGHAESTWATPNGPVDGSIITENWGLGLGWSRLQGFDDVIYLLGITPINATSVDMRSTTWVARKRGDGSIMTEAVRDLWVAQQNDQVDADMKVWTHMSYIENVPWTQSETSSMRVLRRWAKQFYVAEDAQSESEASS